MIFMVTPLVEEARKTKGWLATVGTFTGVMLVVMVATGLIVGLMGGSILDALADGRRRALIATIGLIVVGSFALVFALGELGLMRRLLPSTGGRPGLGRLGGLSHYRRTAVLGLVFGGSTGIFCPLPTFWALLLMAAFFGPVWGAGLMGTYALGIVFPVFAIGLLMFFSVQPRAIGQWLAARQGLWSGA